MTDHQYFLTVLGLKCSSQELFLAVFFMGREIEYISFSPGVATAPMGDWDAQWHTPSIKFTKSTSSM
jgi:hypothetical protein